MQKIRKTFLMLVGLTFATATFAQDSDAKIRWMSLDEAYAAAQKEPRKIFIDVYTDWCGWCKRMDKDTFAKSDVVEYVNEHYYAVKLNPESKENIVMNGQEISPKQLAANFKVRAYPTVVLLDETFASFEPVPGYKNAGDFLKMLKLYNQ